MRGFGRLARNLGTSVTVRFRVEEAPTVGVGV